VVIVSLSNTAQDEIADIVSRSEADSFMSQLCSELHVPVPRYVPTLVFYVAQACTPNPLPDGTVCWRLAVSACSDGQPSPLPHVTHAAVRVWSPAGDEEVFGPKDAACKLERCECVASRDALDY
jgi:hypothetical protein